MRVSILAFSNANFTNILMLYDAQRLAIKTDSPTAIQLIHQFIDQVLLYGKAAEQAILQGPNS